MNLNRNYPLQINVWVKLEYQLLIQKVSTALIALFKSTLKTFCVSNERLQTKCFNTDYSYKYFYLPYLFVELKFRRKIEKRHINCMFRKQNFSVKFLIWCPCIHIIGIYLHNNVNPKYPKSNSYQKFIPRPFI